MSLLTVLAFAACSDGLDNIEYDRNSGITIATAQVTATTGTSLTVTASTRESRKAFATASMLRIQPSKIT